MARKEIDIGIVGNDGTGDSIREAFRKVNDNFREMYAVFGQGGKIKLQDLDNVVTEEREIFPLVQATGLMVATITPLDGTAGFTRSITSSNNLTDEYTCVSTIGMTANDKVVFSGNVFGGVTNGTTYYINTVVDNFKFTISTTQDGLGINRILTTNNTGQLVKPRTIVGEDGINIDIATDPERIIITNSGSRLSSDTNPTLGYPLNAGGNIIGNLGNPTQLAVNAFNNLYGNEGVFITTNDVAISKGYADKNYIRKSGGGGGAGGQIRARFEPINRDEYTFTITTFTNGNAVIPNHGFDSAIDGATYVYNTTGTVSTGLQEQIAVTHSAFVLGRTYKIVSLGTTNFVTLGASYNKVGEIFVATTSTATGNGQVKPVYFIRYVDANSFSIHHTVNDAGNNTNKILVTKVDNTAVETLVDAYLDLDLAGNYVSNEVLPRTSVVRRQGDIMTGALMLHDHPTPFDGIGTPNGPADLQAATKYYVDNSSFTSELNLHVSTKGSDDQANTPPGKEGRSLAYAFASVGKACEFAEYFMKNADNETGPYRQLIAYNNGASLSVVSSYTPAAPGNLAIIKFTNYNGIRVDQGALGNEDISPGKLLVGRLSGAKGVISKYYGDDGSGLGVDYLELVDVVGTYIPGENLEFGNNIKKLHITIHVESGIYEEDYPIKLPANTAIVGDEFRRVLIRPKDRISRSPWADTWFFRNTEFDGLTLINSNNPEPKLHYPDFELAGWFSHHYYRKPGKPINPGPKYTNTGNYTVAAALISTNKSLIQQGIINYINSLGASLTPIKETKSFRDVGFIVDGIVSDLIDGGNEKIVNLQEVFSKVTTLDAYCKQGIQHISTYINTSAWFSSQPVAVKTLITNMINRIYFGFNSDYNTPKNNNEMDVFLCDDASIIRQVTCQGHGGFMMVLDPDGQVLTKSPYCQQSGSFSGSINKQAFRGGQYIDGFAGNLKVKVVEKLSNYRLRVTDVPREPEIPSSFYIDGERFKVNGWVPYTTGKVNAGKLMLLNKPFMEAQCISYLDSFNIKYKLGQFKIFIGLIIDGIIFDTKNVGNIKSSRALRRLFTLDDLSLRVSGNQEQLLKDVVAYIKTNYLKILANSASNLVTINQDDFSQVIDPTLSVESGSTTIVTGLMNNFINVLNNGIEQADDLDYPDFILNLDPNSLFNSINPTYVTLITPGNTSMLSNDYTQVNDLGYGIVTNNKGLAECVSVFSYYCWASMYSGFGGQIRSLNSSSANGEYGLVAIGADPLEIPDVVTLADNTVQVAQVVRTGDFANDNTENTLSVFIKNWQYYPYNVSIIEVNHGGSIGQVRYELSNISIAERNANNIPTVLKLNLNTSGNNDSATSGLRADLQNNQNVIIRAGQNFKFSNVFETNPIRPSTALTFEGDPDLTNAPVYRVISYKNTDPIGDILNPTINNPGGYTTQANLINAQQTAIKNAVVAYINSISSTPLNSTAETKSRNDTGNILTALINDLTRGGSAKILETVVNYGNTQLDLNCRLGILYIATYINTNILAGQTAVNTVVSALIRKVYTGDEAILTFDTNYAYILFTIDRPRITIVDSLNAGKTLGSKTGDVRIAIKQKQSAIELARINTGQMITAWDGKMHRVVSYVDQTDANGIYGVITLTEFGNNVNASPVAIGIQSPINITDQTLALTLRAGLQAGEQANIRVRISTLRATGHDFLDIGTGGYNTSNYPSKIFGAPRPSIQANEVVEKTSGRVFYVSTDQNGFFRVGRFFTVDQGTGTVKFSASIALSNLDGIGFKRGVEIAEFSDDETFADLASDAVPTETATDGYIGRRLGLRRDGSLIPNNQKIGPGYLALNGALQPTANISWGGQKLTSLADPTLGSDAANKNYVDSLANTFNSLSKKLDTITTTAAKGDLLVSFGNVNGSEIIKGFSHANIIGDIQSNLVSSATSTLTVAIPVAGSINSITLADATNFPGSGYVLIDQEVFYYAIKSGNNLDTIRRLSESDEVQNASTYQINFKFQKGFSNSHAVGATVISLNTLKLDYQITPEIIVNADVSPTAGILQSKLNMRKADLFDESDSVTGWASTNKTQADLGLAKFSDDNFETNLGYVRIKEKGIAKTDIEVSGPNTILGNLDRSTSYSPIDLAPKDVYKRAVYDSLREAIPSDGKKYVWSIQNLSTEAASTQAPLEYTINATGGTLVLRTGEGHIQISTIENDDAGQIITSSGSTPATVYKGSWNPGTNATLRATTANAWHTARTLSVGGAGSGSVSLDGSADATLNLTVTTVSTGGSVTTSTITTGAATTAGTITGAWTLTSGSTLQATYADLAEWYTSDKKYDPGTVVVFGGLLETTVTNQLSDTRVAGVVTTNPAYTMNKELANNSLSVCIALQGRVPCRVVGRVQKGDLLTTSASPGCAIRATNPVLGSIIGKALENKDTLEAGMIEIAVGRM